MRPFDGEAETLATIFLFCAFFVVRGQRAAYVGSTDSLECTQAVYVQFALFAGVKHTLFRRYVSRFSRASFGCGRLRSACGCVLVTADLFQLARPKLSAAQVSTGSWGQGITRLQRRDFVAHRSSLLGMWDLEGMTAT